MSKRYLISYICLLFSVTVSAQSPANWGIEPMMVFGKIIKHTPKFTYTPPKFSSGFNCNLIYKTYGKKDWHEWQGYPVLGLNFGYYNLGDKEVLGEAFSFFPNVTVRLFGNDKLNMNFMFGSGIAFLNKHFDYLENPTNNSIGSTINNISSFQFNGRLILSNRLSVLAGFGLTHFSNGTSKLPNLGINLTGINLGVQYVPNPIQKDQYIKAPSGPTPDKKFGLSTHIGLAFVERTIPGGPKYPIYIASLAGTYAFSKVNRFAIGVDYENNKSDYYFYLNSVGVNTEAEAKTFSTHWLLFIADEFFFWPYSFVLQAGTYVDGDPLYPISYFFTKLSFRYYLPPFAGKEPRIYLAIHLKAHKFNAQYISWGLGATL